MKKIETDMDLLQWVADAGPGDCCEYHRGNLAQDRWPNEKQLSALASTAYDLSKQCLVHLVQERVDEGFSYQAISRVKPPLFVGGDN